MTGDILAAELMRIRPDIPVILCTGYSRTLSEETVAQIPIRALAYKPIVKKELAHTIRNILDEAKNRV
jgi:DNA-binding NtrC family response regulator